MNLVFIDLPLWFVYMSLFILGTVVGSFLNVCIYRIPTRDRLWPQLQRLWDGPSRCGRCHKRIPWQDNIPIFGWLKLRGRCSQCKAWISPRYMFIELLNGLLFMLVFYLEVPTGGMQPLSDSLLYTSLGPEVIPGIDPLSANGFVWIRLFYHLVLIEALLVASFIDFDTMTIPDGSTVPAMIFGVLASLGIGRVHLLPVWWQSPRLQETFSIILPDWVSPWLAGPEVPPWIALHPHAHGLVVSLVGMVFGAGIVWIVQALGFLILRKEAMGTGDIFLMALVGAYLGWQATLVAFFIAPIVALTVVIITSMWSLLTRRELQFMIPYGPYLSIGSVITMLYWGPIFERTEHVFGLGPLLIPIALFMVVTFGLSLVLMQGVKWLLGIPLGTPDELQYLAFRASDQNLYLAGEKVDRHTCRWRTQDWEGCAAGQGRIHEERWRGHHRDLRPPRML